MSAFRAEPPRAPGVVIVSAFIVPEDEVLPEEEEPATERSSIPGLDTTGGGGQTCGLAHHPGVTEKRGNEYDAGREDVSSSKSWRGS